MRSILPPGVSEAHTRALSFAHLEKYSPVSLLAANAGAALIASITTIRATTVNIKSIRLTSVTSSSIVEGRDSSAPPCYMQHFDSDSKEQIRQGGGCRCLYSLYCREGEFSETQFPVLRVLGHLEVLEDKIVNEVVGGPRRSPPL